MLTPSDEGVTLYKQAPEPQCPPAAHSLKFQGPTARLSGSTNASLPVLCSEPGHNRVVRLAPRMLHAVREVALDMIGLGQMQAM